VLCPDCSRITAHLKTICARSALRQPQSSQRPSYFKDHQLPHGET
jgi:hypothetical protein